MTKENTMTGTALLETPRKRIENEELPRLRAADDLVEQIADEERVRAAEAARHAAAAQVARVLFQLD